MLDNIVKKKRGQMQLQMSPTLRCSVDTVHRGHHPHGYLYDTANITMKKKLRKRIL